MFNKYTDKIQYKPKAEKKDLFGYGKAEPVDLSVRYIGGKTVEITESNAIRTEHRFLYQCPIQVFEGETFVIDGKDHEIKKVERVVDVFGKTVFYEVEVI